MTKNFGITSDIFKVRYVFRAFGCTMLELLDLTYPFDDMDLFEVVVNLRQKTHAPKINSDWPSEIQSILAQCWDFEPENRPTAKEVYYALHKIVDPNSSITSSPNDTSKRTVLIFQVVAISIALRWEVLRLNLIFFFYVE